MWVLVADSPVNSDSPFVRDVDFEWTVDGQTYRQRRDVLEPGEVWKVSAQVPGSVSWREIHARVTGGRITWLDAHRTTRWRSSVEIAPAPISWLPGQFAPNASSEQWDDRPWEVGHGASVNNKPPEIAT
jgi:hypothetical protein